MSTAGNERGLSLRSPGRFCAAADRLLDLYRAHPDPTASARVVDAWTKAQAYRLYTWGTVTRLAAGGDLQQSVFGGANYGRDCDSIAGMSGSRGRGARTGSPGS